MIKAPWNLVLVNRENYLPQDWEISLTMMPGSECVDSRIVPELRAMTPPRRRTVCICMWGGDTVPTVYRQP